jgi:CRP/FNR family transcriptional regulator, cyclic AMP receptor protein
MNCQVLDTWRMAIDVLVELERMLRQTAPSAELGTGLLAPLRAWVHVERHRAGEVVVAQGQRVGALRGVLSGEVDCQLVSADGTTSVLEHVGPLRWFGLTAFVTDQPSTYEALARCASRTLVVGPQAYAHLMDRMPGFARALMTEFARRHASTLQQLAAARHLSARDRVWLALDQIRQEQAVTAVREGRWLQVRVTQSGLAQTAGLSRQTTHSLLAEMEAQGQVKRCYGGLWLAG